MGSAPSPSAAGGTTRGTRREQVLNVLYLFSGAQRKSSVTAVLQQQCKQQDVRCIVHDVDIQNSADWDLSRPEVQQKLKTRLTAGEFDVALITPPCSTWSRVRGANCRGPPMIRSRQYVWGFPWLSARHSKDAELGNVLVLFMLDVLDILEACPISQNGATVLLFAEHPEDLGVGYREEDKMRMDPASIWQLQRLRDRVAPLSPLHLFTVVFNQCCWGAPYRKPTRSITNLVALKKWGACDWPRFDPQGHYAGPQLSCACHPTVTLARTSDDPGFRTSTTSAYPVQMDQALAEAILAQWLHSPLQAKEGEFEVEKKPSEVERKPKEKPGEFKKRQLEEAEESAAKRSTTSSAGRRPGAGPPIQVSYKGETRALHDGAGLCSRGGGQLTRGGSPSPSGKLRQSDGFTRPLHFGWRRSVRRKRSRCFGGWRRARCSSRRLERRWAS